MKVQGFRFDPTVHGEVSFTLKNDEATEAQFVDGELTLTRQSDDSLVRVPVAGATNVTRWHIVEEQA